MLLELILLSMPATVAAAAISIAERDILPRDGDGDSKKWVKYVAIIVPIVVGLILLGILIRFFRHLTGCGSEKLPPGQALGAALKNTSRPAQSNGGYSGGGGYDHQQQAQMHYQQQEWERTQQQNNEWFQQNYGR